MRIRNGRLGARGSGVALITGGVRVTFNERKQELLRAGLGEFVHSGPSVWSVAGVLGPIHADSDAWEKIADVIADYARWMHEEPQLAEQGPAGYDAVARLVQRDQLRTSHRRS